VAASKRYLIGRFSNLSLYQALCETYQSRADADLTADPSTNSGLLVKWMKHYNPVLAWACFNAFELRRYPQRGKTHMFSVTLEATKGRRRKARKAFKVTSATLLDRETLREQFSEAMELFQKQESVATTREDKRVFTPMLLQHNHHWQLMYYYWFDRELLTMREDAHWPAVFQSMTSGKNEYEMVQGNPVRKEASGVSYHCPPSRGYLADFLRLISYSAFSAQSVQFLYRMGIL
jgi:hypothetical protein